jgi:hypothetical protein
VPLDDVVIARFKVRLDVYQTTANSPSTIAGAPAQGAIGVLESGTPPADFPADTAWPAPDPISVLVPTAPPGTRQWLRVREVTYEWTAAGQITGSTLCRLEAPIQSATSGGTVTQPLFGFLGSLSAQYPDSALDFAAGEAKFSDFADRLTVEASDSAPLPPSSNCTVTDPSGCTLGQQITSSVLAGRITQQAARAPENPESTSIILHRQGDVVGPPYDGDPSVVVSRVPQVMEGPLNPVTVTDVRGGVAGWSLTAELTAPFVEIELGTIDESQARIVGVACTPIAGSASRAPGSGGTLESAVTLCGVDAGVDDSEGQSGSGQYTISGRFELTVPAFQKAGEYTSTLQITLA